MNGTQDPLIPRRPTMLAATMLPLILAGAACDLRSSDPVDGTAADDSADDSVDHTPEAISTAEAVRTLSPLAAAPQPLALGDGAALRYHATGFTDPPNEGPYPGATGPAFPVTQFDLDVVLEVGGDRLRIDRIGVNPGPGFVVDQIERIDGDVGVAEGANALGFPLGVIASDRVAALVRTQRLLNPTLLIREAVANPSLILSTHLVWDGTQKVLRIVLDNVVSPISLDVALAGGPRIVRAATMENDPLLRDSEVEIEYGQWVTVPGFGRMPLRVDVWHDGYLLRSEQRSAATGLVAIQPGEIDVDKDALPPADLDLASIGRGSAQAQLSFPPPISFPDARPAAVFASELSPGVFFVGGTFHNSLLVEQADRLVLIEAPGYPERSVAIDEWATAQFPDKAITHVVATHHHSDHSAGLREFVARDAAIVVGASTASFFANDVLTRSSTIVPDTLSTLDDVEPLVIAVDADAPWTLDDPVHPVVVVPVASAHASDMVVAYLPQDGMLFNSDLYSPDFPATNEAAVLAGATELNTAIEAFELDVVLMPSGHGFVVPTYDQFAAEFGF